MAEEKNEQEQQDQSDQYQLTFQEIKTYFKDIFKEFLALDKGVDKRAIIKEIKDKQAMSGANAWMLMCSILIASIGLNLDSQAVIIGAMLISPLMSPILGIGLGVAINDKYALLHALLHFGAAILIALIFSTLYFWLIPLDNFTAQIEARTKPTFLDVLIAIFGGIAGIVSLVRKDISTTLPGVAIATALMPPLCVTGYGLANGNWAAATSSFYLFFINSFFVAFSTYLILRLLKFPHKEYASKKERRNNMIRVGLFSFLMCIPSFLIFRNVIREYSQEDKIQKFVEENIGDDDIFLDDHMVKIQADGSKKLYLKVYGETISDDSIPKYEQALKNLGIKKMKIEIIHSSEIPLVKIKQIETQLFEVGDKLNEQIDKLKEERDVRQKLIENMKEDSDFLLTDNESFNNAIQKVKIFIPEIEEIGLSNVNYSDFDNKAKRLPTVIVKWDKPGDIEKEKLRQYIQNEFKLDTVRIVIVGKD